MAVQTSYFAVLTIYRENIIVTKTVDHCLAQGNSPQLEERLVGSLNLLIESFRSIKQKHQKQRLLHAAITKSHHIFVLNLQ